MQTFTPALVSVTLADSTGAPYASAIVQARDQVSNQPLRLYADALGLSLISDMGMTTTDANGVFSAYIQTGRSIKILVKNSNGVTFNTFNDIQPGDLADISRLTTNEIIGLRKAPLKYAAPRTLAQLTGTPSAADLALGSAAEFFLDVDPNQRYFPHPSGLVYLKSGRSKKIQGNNKMYKARSALAKMLTGTQNMTIAVIADSIGRGYNPSGGTERALSSWPAKLAEHLRRAGFTSNMNSIYGDGSLTPVASYDSRIAITGSFTGSGIATAGGNSFKATAAGTFWFTPPTNVDTFEIWWKRSATAGHFTWAVNAGGTTDIDVSGASSLQKTTVSTSLAANTLKLAWVSGAVEICAIKAYNSAAREISVINCSISGGTTGTLSASGAVWSQLTSISNYHLPDLTIICAGVNDWNNSVDIPTVQTNLTTMITTLQAASTPGDILVITPPCDNRTGTGFTANQEAYRSSIETTALTNGVNFLRSTDLYSSFAEWNTAGLMVDANVHPNATGLQLWGKFVGDAILEMM